MLSRRVQEFGEYDIPALNAMTTPEQKLDYLNQQLQAVATAATQAKARGDDADLANIVTLYRQLHDAAAQLRGEVNDAQSPSDFMVALDRFSDSAIAVAKQIGGTALDITQAAGTTAKIVPLLLVGLVVVLGIGFYKGSLSASVRR